MMVLALAAAQAADASGGETNTLLILGIAAILLVVSIGLFFVEVLIPSFGLISLMGIACAGGSIVVAFSVGSVAGFGFLAATAVLVPTAVGVALKLLRKTAFVLRPEFGAKEGPGGGGAPAAAAGRAGLVPGMIGVTLTQLRPAGTAVFHELDERKVSVVSTGDIVEASRQIEIVSVDGTRTVVRPARAAGKEGVS